jgi:hypothetical protein
MPLSKQALTYLPLDLQWNVLAQSAADELYQQRKYYLIFARRAYAKFLTKQPDNSSSTDAATLTRTYKLQ